MPKEDGLITLIDDVETQVTIATADGNILTPDHVKIIGVPQLHNYKSCLQCRARVEPLSLALGKCTNHNCKMIQLYDLCKDHISAKILLQYKDGDGNFPQMSCYA